MSTKSLSHEVLRYLLHNFTEVVAFCSSAAVCAEWHRVLHDEAFWKTACAQRWPYIAAIPIQDFFKYYRSHVISQRDEPDLEADAAKFNEWLLDTYLMIDARVAGKSVSLALPFREAIIDNKAVGWQVSQFGYDESGDDAFKLGELVLKTCHLWRASDGRMCLLTKDKVMRVQQEDIEHWCCIRLKPARFFAEAGNSMSLQLHYSESGLNAHESVMHAVVYIAVSYAEISAEGEYTPTGASLQTPILTLQGSFDNCSFVDGQLPSQPQGAPAFFPCVGMCDWFRLTSIMDWK